MRDNIFIPEHKTNVLPLRWLANYIFHPISMWFFRIGLKANDKLEYDHDYKWHNKFLEWIGWKWYKVFDVPYSKWGTYYKFDASYLDGLGGSGWDDYDDSGIPYWDYWWHEDEETGDAWRLVNKNGTSN